MNFWFTLSLKSTGKYVLTGWNCRVSLGQQNAPLEIFAGLIQKVHISSGDSMAKLYSLGSTYSDVFNFYLDRGFSPS